ncbi:MAG: hypothetical protein JWP27_2261 [Flaviaesturariibacter sp.]|nr:hypothetical protein [Flaviaesturariibacter sp.]
MKRTLPWAILLCPLLIFSSCSKEKSLETGATSGTGGSGGSGGSGGGTGGGGTGGGTGGGGTNASCNATLMKIKRVQATFAAEDFLDAEWNADGTVKNIKMHQQLSEFRTAEYVYANNRISEAILFENLNSNQLIDTVVFHYSADGKVDSMYRKNDDWFNIKLTYTGGKLTKWTRYVGTDIFWYWDIETDANGNLVKAVEWQNSATGFTKESTYTYSRDDRKNPFAGLAPYMFYLDDDYAIFRHWGANNYVDQRYIDHSGTGIDLTTGLKYKYNGNCYPASAENTIMGSVFIPGDSFIYTYF